MGALSVCATARVGMFQHASEVSERSPCFFVCYIRHWKMRKRQIDNSEYHL